MSALLDTPTTHMETPVVPRKQGSQKQAKKLDAKPKRDRARDRGEVVALGVEITSAHDRAIEECRAKLRWSKRVFVEAALEEFLAKHGAWPPVPPTE